jgi:DNA-binding response OmpR family regulator
MAALILALLEEHNNGSQVKTCLESCSHEEFVVESFQKALALLSVKKIDLIISDIHLENGGSIFDFCGRSRKVSGLARSHSYS